MELQGATLYDGVSFGGSLGRFTGNGYLYVGMSSLLLKISSVIRGSIEWPSVLKRKLITRLFYWERSVDVLALVLTLQCVWIITMLLRCSVEIVWLLPARLPGLIIMPNR